MRPNRFARRLAGCGPRRRSRVAGVLLTGGAAGAAGFVAFVILHAWLIAPIWDRSLHGLPFALIAGLGLAWAFDAQYHNEAARRPVAAGIHFGTIVFATLVPPTVYSNALRLAGLHPNDWPGSAIGLAFAIASGALAGYRLAGRAREMATATTVLTIAMGGPIPVVNSVRAAWLFATFLPICVAAGIVVSIGHRWFVAPE